MPLSEADTRAKLIDPAERAGLLAALPDGSRSALVVQSLDDLIDCDLYDVLAELGYGLAPRTRVQRAEAFGYKHAAWLASLPALAAQFARAGTDSLENPQVFQLLRVQQAGGLPALRALSRPGEVLRETKARLFAA